MMIDSTSEPEQWLCTCFSILNLVCFLYKLKMLAYFTCSEVQRAEQQKGAKSKSWQVIRMIAEKWSSGHVVDASYMSSQQKWLPIHDLYKIKPISDSSTDITGTSFLAEELSSADG